MTEAEMKEQLESANDLLQGVLNQRNTAQNECVQLNAALLQAKRKIEMLERSLAETKSTDETDLFDVKPVSNGHAPASAQA